MIIGKGLLAVTLSQYKNDEDILIFASGVSNSRETKEEGYRREKDLFLSAAATSARVVYFSTCSVFDESLVGTRYVQHKLEMEKLVADKCGNYLIVRLPILMGKTTNPNTFFNFIANSIIHNRTLCVHRNASRYLFDADDLEKLFPVILKETLRDKRTEINVAFDNACGVPEIVEMIENITDKQTTKELIDEGSIYPIDNTYFISLLERNDIATDKNYNYMVLKKYLSDFK
jgi:nucleoside-diphosphate-sugar epimerase